MADKPTYMELKKRVSALEARERLLAEAQQNLQRNLNFTESLMASIPAPVFWKDAQGRYQGCNRAFTEIMGVTADAIQGKTVEELWPSKQAAVYHQKDLEILANPQQQVYEFEVTDKAGKRRPVVYYKNVFRDERGAVAGLVGGFVDMSEKARVYETLRRQHNLLNSLFDNLPMGIAVCDAKGRMEMVNKGFTRLTGYSLTEIPSLDDWFSRAYPDPDYRRTVGADWRASRRIPFAKGTYKVTCRDGGVKDVDFRVATLQDGRTLVALADITERRKALEEREASHRLLHSVLDAVPDLLIVVDRDYRIRYSNYRGHDLVQPLHGALDRTCYGRFKHLDAPCEDCSAAPVFGDGRIVEREMVNPADGRIREVRAFPIFDADGRVENVVEYVRDITDIRRVQEEIRQRRQFLESVLYHAPDAIVTLDENHRVVDWNPGAVKIFGFSPEEAISRPLDDLVARHAHRAEASAKTTRVLSGRRVEAFETVRYRKDGAPVHVTAAGSPIMDEGTLKGAVAVYTDITERVRNEEALRKAQKMEAIGTLASGIAHDFNNLLMGIQGRASLVSADLSPDHPHTEHIAAIEEYITSAVSLTKQLLGMAQGGKYEVKPIDVNALLASTAEMFGRTRKQIRVRTKTASEPMVVNADKRQMEQVLLNVYINAWQAMPSGGDLTLKTRPVSLTEGESDALPLPPGSYVEISLTDTGIGMPEKVQQQVFDPFFTTKEKGRGTGLGMASAYGIVRNHGGMMSVCSEEGRGSTFFIHLPLSEQDVVPESPAAQTLVGGAETILLVDDETMIVEVGKAMLERLGYGVLTAGSGAAAIETVFESGQDIDLVILDLIMPEIDGGKCFDRIREIRSSIPVILSSGYSINGQAMEIMERGCNGFLQKPFNLADLARKIREVLDAGKAPPR